jgi:hypothetical protein
MNVILSHEMSQPTYLNSNMYIIIGCDLQQYYEKMGWFTTSLVIGYLNCNDHLQFNIYSTCMSAIKQVAWVVTHAIHRMWNFIHMQLVQRNYNYVKMITMQL